MRVNQLFMLVSLAAFQVSPILCQPFNGTEKLRDEHLVIIFNSSEKWNPGITSKDIRVFTNELQQEDLRSNSQLVNLSECTKQRKERGVTSCWVAAPCFSWNIYADDQYEENCDKRDQSEVCPLLLYWLNGKEVDEIGSNEDKKPSELEVWGYGILCCAIISLSGVSGIIFLPLIKRGFIDEVMNLLVGLAFGSLSATAAIQLLPEVFSVKELNKPYLMKTLIFWGTMWVFYLISTMTSIATGRSKKNNERRSNESWRPEKQPSTQTVRNAQEIALSSSTDVIEGEEDVPADMDHDQLENNLHSSKISATPGMIMLGDSLHNFVDGMSIGAAFSESLVNGFTISSAVAFEEFPHELGDFAVLIKYGYPFKKALLLNYASACSIFLGLIVGTLLGQIKASIYIYAISAGMFLYISLGELVPELKGMVIRAHINGIKPLILCLSLQNAGILIAVFVIYSAENFF